MRDNCVTLYLLVYHQVLPPSVILVELLVPWQKLSLYDVLVFVYMCVSCVVFRISKITLVMMYPFISLKESFVKNRVEKKRFDF